MKGNAEFSTLRFSLGCLLASELNIILTVDARKRMSFGTGEDTLSSWMQDNALVVWAQRANPWEVEGELIRRVSLPLNLEHNKQHQFRNRLSAIRKKARADAKTKNLRLFQPSV